jgi:hypothetical protein
MDNQTTPQLAEDIEEKARLAALSACRLLDNPFNPERDPTTNFSFRENGISLVEALDVFGTLDEKGIAVLEPFYFSRAGCFGALVSETEQFLRRKGRMIDSQSPFTVLISGADHVGTHSAASYIAHKIRQRCSRPPALRYIKVQGDDYGAFLALVTEAVKAHGKAVSAPDLDTVVSQYETLIRNEKAAGAASSRVEGFYLNLLLNLRDPMRRAPWLIILVDEITADRRSWILNSRDALTPAKVLPIYLTKESGTSTKFAKLLEQGFDGLGVVLGEIDAASADEFVRTRIEAFRAGPAPSGSFPFSTTAVSDLVSGEKNGVTIRFLIDRLKRAVEERVEELIRKDPHKTTDKDVVIQYEHIRLKFKDDLNKH